MVTVVAMVFLVAAIAPGTAFAKRRRGKGAGRGGGKRVAIVVPVNTGAATVPLVVKIVKVLKAHKITPLGGAAVKKALGNEPPQTDDGWARAAATLKADAIIESTMSQTGTKNRLEIVVHNGADGSTAGRAIFTSKGPPRKLAASVGALFWKKLGPAIAGTRKGEGSALPVRDLSATDSDARRGQGDATSPTGSEREDRGATADRGGKRKKAEDREGDGERSASREGADEGEEGGEDAGEEEDTASSRSTGGALRSAEVELDLRVLRRTFQYSPASAAKAYQLKVALLVGGQAFWYPFKYAGVFAKGEWTTSLMSGAYPTVTRELVIGAQGRYPLSAGEVHLNLAYFQHLYWIQESPDTADAPRNTLTTPNVTYQGLRLGGGGRFYLNERMLVGVDGGYRFVTNPGSGTDQIRSAGYFPNAAPFIAFDAAGFFGFKLMDFLEARISVDYRRYVFGMQTGPTLTVAGISDDYSALNLGLVGVLGGK